MKIYFQRHLMVFVGICTLISGISRVMSPSDFIDNLRIRDFQLDPQIIFVHLMNLKA